MSMKRQSLKAALSVGGVVRCAGSVRNPVSGLSIFKRKRANSKLGIDPVLPEIVFSSRAKRLEGGVLFLLFLQKRTSSLCSLRLLAGA